MVNFNEGCSKLSLLSKKCYNFGDFMFSSFLLPTCKLMAKYHTKGQGIFSLFSFVISKDEKTHEKSFSKISLSKFTIKFLIYSVTSGHYICFSGLPHPGKVLDFFCCSGNFLNFVYKSWKVLENIWAVSCASPRQNSEATFLILSSKNRNMKE